MLRLLTLYFHTFYTLAVEPHLNDVYRLLKSHSNKWESIGRELKVDFDFRKNLKCSTDDNPCKLEEVLNKWLISYCSKPTWDNLIDVLERIELKACAQEVKQYLLNDKDAIRTYNWKGMHIIIIL